MITKTKKYKIKIDTPWALKGYITSEFENTLSDKGPEDYPDYYDPIYELEDGSYICVGDLVWREKNGVVKQVQFSQVHIDKNSRIFGSAKSCEKWLETNASNIRTQLLKSNRDSSFQTLKSLVKKLDNMEELSLSDLYKIREGLKNCISNIENI